MSAPPTSVTCVQAPEKLSQLPFVRVAESRSTMPDVASMPACASLPLSSVSGTERAEYHGPPESDADWPLGPVESAAIVTMSLAVAETPFVATIDPAPGALAPAVQL